MRFRIPRQCHSKKKARGSFSAASCGLACIAHSPRRKIWGRCRRSFALIPAPIPRWHRALLVLLTSRPAFGLHLKITDSASTLPFSRLAQCSFSLCSRCSLLRLTVLFASKASRSAVAGNPRSDCFRLEQQLPGGISSSHWINVPFHGTRVLLARCSAPTWHY